MNSKDYWKRRQLEREQKFNDLIEKDLDRIIKFYYEQSLLKIQKDIAALYAQYAVENKLSMSEAKRLIRGKEFSQWRMTLQEYVKAAKNDSDILKELNTLAMRSRISRFEALHARTMMEVADLCEKLEKWENAFQYRAYTEHLYGNLYDIHKTEGLNTPPVAVDKKHVEEILTTPWSGKNYSQRIWKNGRKLERAIQSTMVQAIHRGSSIQKLSKDLSERMNVAYHNAERLVRTELNYIENRAALDAIKEADLGFYQFVATLDNRTTPMCQSLDGRIFPIEEKNQGENAPPMHVRCRSTVIGTLDDGKSGRIIRGKRAATDENGKRIKIPADMNYNDWKKVYIEKTQTLDDWKKAKEPPKPKASQQFTELNNDAKQKGILHNPVKTLQQKLSGDDIIKRIGGGDMTTGSCSSLGFTYIGNKNGLDVIDFRGGASQEFFSLGSIIRKIAELPGVKSQTLMVETEAKDAAVAIKKLEQGKEFYLSAGKHAAIVRNNNGIFEYLELQSSVKNGWTNFNRYGSMVDTLCKRFGCRKTKEKIAGVTLKKRLTFMEVDSFANNEEFKELLGYINTDVNKQMKGATGHIK